MSWALCSPMIPRNCSTSAFWAASRPKTSPAMAITDEHDRRQRGDGEGCHRRAAAQSLIIDEAQHRFLQQRPNARQHDEWFPMRCSQVQIRATGELFRAIRHRWQDARLDITGSMVGVIGVEPVSRSFQIVLMLRRGLDHAPSISYRPQPTGVLRRTGRPGRWRTRGTLGRPALNVTREGQVPVATPERSTTLAVRTKRERMLWAITALEQYTGHLKPRAAAELAIEHLVQEQRIDRADVFVHAQGDAGSAGKARSGADTSSRELEGSDFEPALRGIDFGFGRRRPGEAEGGRAGLSRRRG